MRTWIESFVIAHNLCPFAKRVMITNDVRFVVTEAVTEENLLLALQAELEFLMNDKSVETGFLIHPNVLQDFYAYNDFLDYANKLLVEMHLEGVFQIASFHPDYQFGGTDPSDVENYTNRSPFPMLHFLREENVEKAIDSYENIDQITARNTELMKKLGADKLQVIMQNCFKHDL